MGEVPDADAEDRSARLRQSLFVTPDGLLTPGGELRETFSGRFPGAPFRASEETAQWLNGKFCVIR